MKTKPTPAPWQVSIITDTHYVDGFAHAVADPRGHLLLEATQKGGSKKALANCRLASAAPDLLASLELCVDRLQDIKHATKYPLALSIFEARAAIAKAKGVDA